MRVGYMDYPNEKKAFSESHVPTMLDYNGYLYTYAFVLSNMGRPLWIEVRPSLIDSKLTVAKGGSRPILLKK